MNITNIMTTVPKYRQLVCNQTTTHAILSVIRHSHMFEESVKSEV